MLRILCLCICPIFRSLCTHIVNKLNSGVIRLVDNWRSDWFKRSWPFLSRFSDIDDVIRNAEEIMKRELKELSKSTPEALVHERVSPDGSRVRSLGPFVYGYSVTIGPEGKPHVREFGNVNPKSVRGKPRIRIKDKWEPLVDVLESKDDVRVVTELPGVTKEEIKLTGMPTGLTISVNSPSKKYYKELKFPCEVNLENAKSSYKNGVLEVTLKKKKDAKLKGKRPRID